MGCIVSTNGVRVQEEEPVVSSEDKTEECKFFCPLCMLFYESKLRPTPHRCCSVIITVYISS
jgi:hypothetical protein